jgi:adenylate cyclase
MEPTGYLIVGLFAAGMAVAFFAADPESPTSRPLSAFFALLGIVAVLNIPAYAGALAPPAAWVRFFSVLEIGILASAFEQVLRIGRTETTGDPASAGGDRAVRVAQALAAVYGAVGVVLPGLRSEVWNVAWGPDVFRRPGFYLFAVPFNLALLLVGVRIVQLLRGRVDRAERLRLVALAVATPFWCSGLFLPARWKPVAFSLGEAIFLIGAIRYHVAQGQRGQFLARFLSPQVVRLVRERGLASTMQQSRSEISVVACDLRGFTAFTETAAPEEIMKLLEEYYRTVGEVVVSSGGSITNFAGDGILALVGAPIACADHARRAIGMALGIRDRVDAILAHWKRRGLGLGIGAASGFVTVGVIGGTERLEYTAVGPAVNLAARLCQRAESGQVLAEPRATGAAGDGVYRFERLESAELKGFARPITIFAVA